MTFYIESKRHGRFKVLIDDADWEEVKKYKWHIGKQPKRKAVYARRNIYLEGKRTPVEIALHTQLTGYKMTDHVNGNGLDCRRRNMREATVSQNRHNIGMRKNNTSGYKGVCFEKESQKWVARIQVNNKNKTIGRYTDITQAALAYNKAAKKYHGKFARLNKMKNEAK